MRYNPYQIPKINTDDRIAALLGTGVSPGEDEAYDDQIQRLVDTKKAMLDSRPHQSWLMSLIHTLFDARPDLSTSMSSPINTEDDNSIDTIGGLSDTFSRYYNSKTKPKITRMTWGELKDMYNPNSFDYWQ